MSITENVKKKQKQKREEKKTTQFAIRQHCSSVGGHFDAVKILPNQQEGTETGKESI